jgi:hypothetical protein
MRDNAEPISIRLAHSRDDSRSLHRTDRRGRTRERDARPSLDGHYDDRHLASTHRLAHSSTVLLADGRGDRSGDGITDAATAGVGERGTLGDHSDTVADPDTDADTEPDANAQPNADGHDRPEPRIRLPGPHTYTRPDRASDPSTDPSTDASADTSTHAAADAAADSRADPRAVAQTRERPAGRRRDVRGGVEGQV